MTWLDLVAQIGGLLGLCLGISVISLIEIGYWTGLSMKAIKATYITKKEKQKKSRRRWRKIRKAIGKFVLVEDETGNSRLPSACPSDTQSIYD